MLNDVLLSNDYFCVRLKGAGGYPAYLTGFLAKKEEKLETETESWSKVKIRKIIDENPSPF